MLTGHFWRFLISLKILFGLIYACHSEPTLNLSQFLAIMGLKSFDVLCKFNIFKPRSKVNVYNLNFQLRVGCKSVGRVALANPTELLQMSDFKRDLPLVIASTGWLEDVNNSDFYAMLGNAYGTRGDSNLVTLDTFRYLQSSYTQSAINTPDIGKYLAVALNVLIEQNQIPLENIHLIGISLGAQIMGSAGRYFKYITGGKEIPRITGLDPAMPCFQSDSIRTISRNDAKYVDIIHTNPGGLGISTSVGHADYYVNGLNPLTPGCSDVLCAHIRSAHYYIESVVKGNENIYLAKSSKSFNDFLENRYSTESYPMGINSPSNARGNMFLRVNANIPYGKNTNRTVYKEIQNCE